jgi:L-asparagine transporter-like permease
MGGGKRYVSYFPLSTSKRNNVFKVGFVAGDMKDPVRDLPNVINTAMLVVTAGFTLMVIALYAVIPIQSMRETSTPIVVGIPVRVSHSD